MSACIVLEDGRSWWAANWAYDAVIERIADELAFSQPACELASWLRTQTCMECGPGLGSIDVRELSPASRMAFRDAAHRALEAAATQGGSDWHQPEFFPGWITTFQDLVGMMDALDRGEPTPAGMHLAEPTGRRIGPGWRMSDEQSDECEPE